MTSHAVHVSKPFPSLCLVVAGGSVTSSSKYKNPLSEMCSLPPSVTWNPSLCLARSCILSNKPNVASFNHKMLLSLSLAWYDARQNYEKGKQLKISAEQRIKKWTPETNISAFLRFNQPADVSSINDSLSSTVLEMMLLSWNRGMANYCLRVSVPWTLCTGSNSGRVFSASLDQLPTRAQAHTWRQDQHPRKVLFERAACVRPTCLNWAYIRTKLYRLSL